MKKLIKKVKNIIFKKKIKKDPQRLKHKVRFNIEHHCKREDTHKSKPIIAFVQAGNISEKKFFIGDVVKSINGIKVKTADNLDNEVNKLNWGDEVFFEVERNNKIEKVNIKTISFEHYKEHCVTWGITIKKVGKLIKIDEVGIEYNIDNEIDVGDTLIAINSEKISSMEDFDRERLKYKVGDNIKFKIKKASYKTKTVNIKLISSGEAIKINKKSCENISKTLKTVISKHHVQNIVIGMDSQIVPIKDVQGTTGNTCFLLGDVGGKSFNCQSARQKIFTNFLIRHKLFAANTALDHSKIQPI